MVALLLPSAITSRKLLASASTIFGAISAVAGSVRMFNGKGNEGAGLPLRSTT